MRRIRKYRKVVCDDTVYMSSETLGLSMEFFKYGAVMPPKLGDVSKMTVE